ncbi:MAG: serine hydrolase domain-containing protein [Roseiflexaceae bacterium]|nr:serine hydrolase domain-containing protein [Roseiflexaceae bacterium]
MRPLSRLAAARIAAETLVASGRIPGVVVAVALGNQKPDVFAVGTDANGRPLVADDLFPVASITKLATALTVLRLVDRGLIELDDPVDRFLKRAEPHPGVTIRRLLCHTAGFAIDLHASDAPYAPGLTWEDLARACLHAKLHHPPGSKVLYSNVGYGLLALVVEARTGARFGDMLHDLVLTPLGIEGYLGVEPPRLPARIADVRDRHRATPLEPFNSSFWRSLALPWAGLVTTAAGALALVRAFCGHPPGFLSPPLRAAAIANQTNDLPGGFIEPLRWNPCPWGLGPEVRGVKEPHWLPAAVGANSFGHTGASGCLAWAAPGTGVAWAILGARTADNGWLLRHSGAISAAIYGVEG